MIFIYELSPWRQENLLDQVERTDRPHFICQTIDGVAVIRCVTKEDIKEYARF